MRISESKLRKIIRSLIVENIFNSEIYDYLDGSIDFSNGEGDLLNNVMSYIKHDIEEYCLTKVESMKWAHRGNPEYYLFMCCFPEDSAGRRWRMKGEVDSGLKEVTFKVTNYPMTKGELGIEEDADHGLGVYKIRNMLGSARLNNEFSCQEFHFECTDGIASDFKIRVYREQNLSGKSRIVLEFV